LTINAKSSDVRVASEWLHDIAYQFEIPQNKAIALDQCLDEVLMNIVMHGGDSAVTTPVELFLETSANRVDITVSDSGKAFDPVNAPLKPRPLKLEDAEPGGLGLSIIKGLSNYLDYQFKEGRNILTFGIAI